MICKVCGAKIPDGMTSCDLCGTVVELNNENSFNDNDINIKKAEDSKDETKYIDPFWDTMKDTSANNEAAEDEAHINKSDLQENSTKTANEDPFLQSNNNTYDKIDENYSAEIAESNGYDFNMQSVNSNYGASKNTKIVIGVLVFVIAIAVTIVIILCTHKNTHREDIQADYTITHLDENTIELEQEEIMCIAHSADDIISFQMVNADSLIPNNVPEYKTYVDEEYGFMIDYPGDFHEIKQSDNNAMLMKWANENNSAILCVYACNNPENITTADLQNRIIDIYGGDITYSPLKDNWFAISLNDDLLYHYAFFRTENNIIKGFEYHFSGQQNLEKYSKYIDHIYSSFVKL